MSGREILHWAPALLGGAAIVAVHPALRAEEGASIALDFAGAVVLPAGIFLAVIGAVGMLRGLLAPPRW
ncbi:hypothetical protein [Wenxinia saemankumensis]|uniref:Uncharacterized protein n=1 Tax=Wenxinia saemankumensis TaxID=1447782 RepID=A0A1M6CMB1_9RHOB|nr:hypothetical protein [Wenxinia saemankumensis]SHI62063.1 hypothetical protein SAMN05444417_1262 [Wenxinia saemankumensis]